MAQDIRVVLIKLADRLHNMRTVAGLPKNKQQEKARETLDIFAPLAHRLGIHAIKWELEDLAFATLHPRKFKEIRDLVNQQRGQREAYVSSAGSYLEKELQAVGITADISGRAKHFYSIYSKMTKKGREFNEIYDLTAMRVLVGSVKDCYGAIGVIHSLWKPLPGRFKDFVAMPKVNGKIVPLHSELQSGDIVEVLTSKQERGPSRDWLALVKTTRAQSKIRAWFKRERREDSERTGREILAENLKRQGLPPQKMAGSPLLADVIRELGFRKADDFYIALGQSKISPKTAVNKLLHRLKEG